MNKPDTAQIADVLEASATYIKDHGLHKGDYWPGAQDDLDSYPDTYTTGAPACAVGAFYLTNGHDRPLAEMVALYVETEMLGMRDLTFWVDTPDVTQEMVIDRFEGLAKDIRNAS